MEKNSSDKTAEKILEAAAFMFAKKGYAGVSVREIISEAKIGNIGAVSYYFGGKKELYLAVLREHFKKVHKMAATLNQNETSPVKKLEKVFEMIGATYKNSPHTIKLLLNEINERGEFFPEIDEEIKKTQKIVRDIIQDGKNQKIFRDDIDSNSMTLIFHSIAQFALLIPNFAKNLIPDDNFEKYLKNAQEIFFRGIMR